MYYIELRMLLKNIEEGMLTIMLFASDNIPLHLTRDANLPILERLQCHSGQVKEAFQARSGIRLLLIHAMANERIVHRAPSPPLVV